MSDFFGNLSALCTPIFAGSLVSSDTFAPAIVYVATLALVEALSYILPEGKLERIAG